MKFLEICFDLRFTLLTTSAVCSQSIPEQYFDDSQDSSIKRSSFNYSYRFTEESQIIEDASYYGARYTTRSFNFIKDWFSKA